MGLGGDKLLIEKLFFILEIQNDTNTNQQKVDFRELIMGIVLFKDISICQKIKTFFALTP